MKTQHITEFDIEKLEEGFLITCNNIKRTGIKDEEHLVSEMQNCFQKEIDLKNLMYLNKIPNVKVTIKIEYKDLK